jgi:diaminopimelate epimerase
VTATAIAASLNTGGTHFAVHTKGGELIVDFTRSGKDFKDVRLTGPVRMVFQGIIDI